jgi:glycosidase
MPNQFLSRWSPLSCLVMAICLQTLPGTAIASAAEVNTKPQAVLQAIQQVEPPSWWVGMHHAKLQLMVHGKQIAARTVALHYPGVKLLSVTRVANPNYVFVDLEIQESAQAGALDLQFIAPTDLNDKLHYAYPLLARASGSAQRRGFDSSDVLLNLVPDRFANGDASNDNQPGFIDQADRSNDVKGRHGGDIQGISDHLDYIAAMGYTMLWPTPLLENNQSLNSYHGYAITDAYKIDARFGSNETYRQLVRKAKSMGLGVIQDIVLNHIGSAHWWMRDLPMKEWLSFDGVFHPTNHAHTTTSDPYAAAIDKQNFIDGWFVGDFPDMNQKNPLVATYQIQNSIWWIEYAGLAGLRIDTYSYNDPAFLTEWSRRLTAEYPRINLVGEEWNGNAAVVSYWQRGKQNKDGYVSYLPSLMDFPLNEALIKALTTPDSLSSGWTTLYQALASDMVYPDPGNLVLFEGNHDLPRMFSLVGEDVDLYKMALTYVLTAPRIPQLYYGTEVLMTSPVKERDDGAVRRDFPGGWAGDKVNAFTGVGLSAQQQQAQAFVKKLLNWRKSASVIHHGQFLHYFPEQGVYVYFRYEKSDGNSKTQKKVMVVMNKNTSASVLATQRFSQILPAHAKAKDVLTDMHYDLSQSLSVPARSVLILDID